MVRAERISAFMCRVTLGGEALEGFDPGLPASSVRLLLPDPSSGELSLPRWDGNEFLRADGSRPSIRTLTPLRFDPAALELDLEVVLHGRSPLTIWAEGARPGSAAGISGPGRGHEVDQRAVSWLLAGDESAIPAVRTLLWALPGGVEARVVLEVRDAGAVMDLAPPDGVLLRWCVLPSGARPGDAMVDAVLRDPELAEGTVPEGLWVWAAGEAAAVQRIRRHLFETSGLDRSRAAVRGYWRLGRAEAG